MWDVVHARWRAAVERWLLLALAAAVLVACGRDGQVQVTAAAGPSALPLPAATSTFQGAVSQVDRGAGAVVVDVAIVWAPDIEAGAHERRVTIGPATRWDPGAGISSLRTGDEVQIDAEDGPDGTWRAVRVRLFDLD